MQLTIYRTNIDATPALLAYIDARIQRSLSRMVDHVGDITVRIADINGPRGGEDKRCAVFVTLAYGQTTLIVDTDSCIYRAVDKVTSRLKCIVRKKLRRAYQTPRRRPRSRHVPAM